MTKFARWAALLLGLVFGALALAQSVVVTGAAVVADVNGSVQMQVGNDAPRPLQKGNRIPAGALVLTGPGANAVLAFADGQVIVLGERTSFRIVDYRFDPKDINQSGVFLNLIEGSARLVMGAIGLHDPRLIRIQVGAGTLVGAANPDGSNAAVAGVVVQGAATLVTVTEGRVLLTLPNGQGILVATGQSAYVPLDGAVQRGSIAQVSAQLGETADGKQIVDRLVALQAIAYPQSQQTVISLATPGIDPTAGLPSPGDIEQNLPLETGSPLTSTTGAAGGGTPCGASCN